MKLSSCLSGALTIAFLEALLFKIASGIECYQCSSIDQDNPFQCNEYMSEDIDIAPASCDDVYGAAFCIKQVGRFDGGLGTKRFCSSLDLGNYCNYIKQPGDVLEYRSCVYTCSSDGCNSSTMKRVQPVVLCISLVFSWLLASSFKL